MSEPITVEIDQPRTLLIDFKAAKALARMTGEGLLDTNRKLQSFDIPTLEKVLCAAAMHEDPNVTLNLSAKRIEAYWDKNGTLAPLFIAATELIDKSGLFNQEVKPGNSSAVTTT